MTAALVTGASGTVGAAVAATLESAGWTVVRHRRTDGFPPEAGNVQLTREDFPCQVKDSRLRRESESWVAADLGVEDVDDAVRRLLAEAGEAAGEPLTAVVHCASTQELTPWADLDQDAWDRVHREGFRATAALTRAAVDALPDGTGVLVLVGSIEGLRPAPDHAAYAVGKAATHHLVAAAAQEAGRLGVRVVGVAPGLVDRPGLATDWPDGVARWSAAAALGRPVTAAEVAAAIGFLVSPAASGITGVTVPVDAGWSAAPGW